METAEKALALVFRSPSPGIKIEFQGGEPLLNFPLIRYVVERAEAWNLTVAISSLLLQPISPSSMRRF